MILERSTKGTHTLVVPVVLVVVIREQVHHRVVALLLALPAAGRLRLIVDVAVIFAERIHKIIKLIINPECS